MTQSVGSFSDISCKKQQIFGLPSKTQPLFSPFCPTIASQTLQMSLSDWLKHKDHSDANLNCTDNYDVAKIKVKSVTDHQ